MERDRTDREAQASQLSPVVMRVIEQFVVDMRDDSEIDEATVRRVESLFLEGDVPRPEDLDVALYGPTPEGQP